MGIELTQDPHANNPNFKTQLVRYHYNSAGDLAEVENRYGERVRQFVYQNHLMVEHGVRGGPAHRYTYEHSPPLPGDKVIAQDNEDALSYRFEYVNDPVAPAQEVPRSVPSDCPRLFPHHLSTPFFEDLSFSNLQPTQLAKFFSHVS